MGAAAVERANNFTQSGAIATRDLHIVTFARYDDGYRAMRDKEPTGSTGATVSIFVGRDNELEAKELRVELGGHSFSPRIDWPPS